MNIRPIVIACLMITCMAPLAQAQLEPAPRALNLDNLSSSASSLTRFFSSPYTLHYTPSPEHRSVRMFGGEKQYAHGEVLGAAVFSNSFGQDSATLYRGARLQDWSSSAKIYAQWAAGLMYGYRQPYDKEVPLNFRGFSPMAVLSLGWQFTRDSAVQLNVLGTAALMLQFSITAP
jgi:hypothetical protein